MQNFYFLVILLFSFQGRANCAKILSLGLGVFKSHLMTYEPLLFELGARGHNVTILAYNPIAKERINVHTIVINEEEKILNEFNWTSLFDSKESKSASELLGIVQNTCEQFYDSQIVQELSHGGQGKYDLVITEGTMPECVAGLLYKLNTSIILITSTVVSNFQALQFGSPSPPSFVPSRYSPFTNDKMNFGQRMRNFIYTIGISAFLHWIVKPRMEEVYRRKLNDSLIPSSDEILGKVSLVLSGSHFIIGQTLPFLPDIIEVGGMHLGPAKPWPEELTKFLGDDEFIYFSFGSVLKGAKMGEKHIRIFLQVFSQLKQKVLWKLEIENNETFEKNISQNVMLSSWFPQQDVLGHPNCKLFITHGGLGGISEAIYHGVPVIGMPICEDQPLNLDRVKERGYALVLDFNEISYEKLFNAVNQILTDERYCENVKKASAIFRDQPQTPLERAVFWTEYVLRHKGAPHLRSTARDLNFLQYHSLDVVGFLFFIIFTMLWICYAILRFFFVANLKNILKKQNLFKSKSYSKKAD